MTTLTTAARISSPTSFDQARHSTQAEWTKIRSLRANRAALLTAFIAVVGIGAAVSVATVHGWDKASPADHAAFDPVAIALTGGGLAQLIIGVLGVLVISAEFSSGTIRTSLAAVPDRRLLLGTKAAVLTAVTFTVALTSSAAAFLLSQHLLAGKHLQTTFGQPGVTRAVIGGALYLSIAALLGLGIASIVRHTAAAVGTLLGVLLVLPSIVSLLPGSLAHHIGRYLPSNAGSAVIKLNPDTWDMAPLTGLALFAGYAIISLTIGAHLLRRRDV